ncbi:phage tail tip lysozyme [Variovorax sp. PBL-E5]|uniref:phage tail tip lysozyme n=1 Tax=Variovorax sp. PBL-E5 TaxID=434014 RepID=UPI001316D463|nr:phage tail tip lysozyme [Variovorax sp. PBL-E5]VTU36222.1 hypothetical protein E5CHR_04259 [Variovorax sp. PBL-E5]
MNNFAITISAVDRATATVRKINDSFSRLTRPIDQIGKSTKALGHELGLDKMAKSIGNVARNARGAASEIGKIGAPLLALVGGGSIVGVAALANEWGRLGSEVARTSRTIGMSSTELQSLRGAAEVAGVSSSELTSGMNALGTTMEDALYGRNQNAVAVLNKLGIGIHKTASGAMDSTRAFKDLADAIANVKSPQQQALIARTMGVEGLLPLLRQGSAGIDRYQQKVRELGGVMTEPQIERARNFGMALTYLDIAGQGLKNTIGDALIPAFQPLIETLTNLISANRVAIGEKIGEWAKDFAKWLKEINWKQLWSDTKDTIKSIGDFVDSIGGWKVAAFGIAGIMAGPLLLSITGIALALVEMTAKTGLAILALGKLEGARIAAEGAKAAETAAAGGASGAAPIGWFARAFPWLLKAGVGGAALTYSGDLNKNEDSDLAKLRARGDARTAVDFFKSKGWSEEQALGIAANLKQESNFNAGAVGDKGSAYGLAQWHADRQGNFAKWAGKNIRQATLEEQMGFVNYELTQGSEKKAGDALRNATDERQSASIVSRLYERPGDVEGDASRRANMATSMKHDIEIKLSGMPAGTKATAQKADGTSVPVRVAAAMPTSVSP